MSTRIEQLTEQDRKIISQNRLKDSIGIGVMVVFLALILCGLYYDTYKKIELTTKLITQNGASKLIAGMIVVILVFTILKMRNITIDLQEGKKEIRTGSITKKRGDKNNSKHYFVIDNIDFRIPKKVFNQFEENEVLSIEQSPKSYYFLNIYRENPPQKN